VRAQFKPPVPVPDMTQPESAMQQAKGAAPEAGRHGGPSVVIMIHPPKPPRRRRQGQGGQ